MLGAIQEILDRVISTDRNCLVIAVDILSITSFFLNDCANESLVIPVYNNVMNRGGGQRILTKYRWPPNSIENESPSA